MWRVMVRLLFWITSWNNEKQNCFQAYETNKRQKCIRVYRGEVIKGYLITNTGSFFPILGVPPPTSGRQLSREEPSGRLSDCRRRLTCYLLPYKLNLSNTKKFFLLQELLMKSVRKDLKLPKYRISLIKILKYRSNFNVTDSISSTEIP